MKPFVRGAAALCVAAAVATTALAQDRTVLTSDRDKVSYAIGMDVANSIKPVGPDLDVAAFEQGGAARLRGGKPPASSQQEAMATDAALRARIAARDGKPVPGAAPGAQPPAVDKAKVGQLVGGQMVGPSLAPIKDEIELPVLRAGGAHRVRRWPAAAGGGGSQVRAGGIRPADARKDGGEGRRATARRTRPRAPRSSRRTRRSRACSRRRRACSTWCCARAPARGRSRPTACA